MVEIIEEIHNTVKVFISKSKKRITTKSLEVESEDSDFLSSIGFNNTDNVVKLKAYKEKESIRNIKKENYNLALDKAKEYHKKYGVPCISLDVVKEICAKYKLICIDSVGYTGKIPKKNIEELKKFKGIEEEDVPYRARTFRYLNDKEKKEVYKIVSYQRESVCRLMNIGKFEPDYDDSPRTTYNEDGYIEEEVFTSSKKEVVSNFWKSDPRKCTDMRIICPPTDANLTRGWNSTIPHTITFDVAKNLGIEILDPIVLLPIGGAKRVDSDDHLTPMFLVMTMWGLESFDKKLNPDGNIDGQINLN